MGKLKKIWKQNGPEDKFLTKLIKDGRVSKNTTASLLKKQHPEIFSDFTCNVVRNHLNELKRVNGMYCKF